MMMRALPKDGVIALVSDHGFERIDRLVDPKMYSSGEMTVTSTMVTTKDAAVAAALRGKDGVGREILQAELKDSCSEFVGIIRLRTAGARQLRIRNTQVSTRNSWILAAAIRLPFCICTLGRGCQAGASSGNRNDQHCGKAGIGSGIEVPALR